jgi:hypothetical protein
VTAALAGTLASAPINSREIWLAPQQGLTNAVDRTDLFKPGPPWKNAAALTQFVGGIAQRIPLIHTLSLLHPWAAIVTTMESIYCSVFRLRRRLAGHADHRTGVTGMSIQVGGN